MNNIYSSITSAIQSGKKLFAVLIDPDKYLGSKFTDLLCKVQPDIILIGGSITHESTELVIEDIKKSCQIPIIQFPGHLQQFSDKADALLFLSLISGRNPDLLIGQHVITAPFIKKAGTETISTGYILIESGETTSVEYMSNTSPIPRTKNDIAAATALAGEMLGNKLIYLEAGSGAKLPVPTSMIEAVKEKITVPLIVGGGLRSTKEIKNAIDAGADIIVIGNTLEKEPELMLEFRNAIR